MGSDLGTVSNSKAGHRWFIVCVDFLTCYVETAPLCTATAMDVASFLLHHAILRHGDPRVVINDRGRQFTAVVEVLLRLGGSQYRHYTAYHPQANGLTERTNHALINILFMYVASEENNWDTVLPFITYAYTTAKHEISGYSPFLLLYVRLWESLLDTTLPFFSHKDLSLAEALPRRRSPTAGSTARPQFPRPNQNPLGSASPIRNLQHVRTRLVVNSRLPTRPLPEVFAYLLWPLCSALVSVL